MNDNKHVIITACEQISAFGCGVQALEQAKMDMLFNAEVEQSTPPHCGLPKDYDFFRLSGLSSNKETRQMDQLAKVTIACANLALQQEGVISEKAGIFLGGAYGCHASNQAFIETLIEHGARFVKPVVFRNTVSNATAGHLAITFSITGMNTVFNSGMVSGTQALAMALHELKSGDSDMILTGASDWSAKLLVKRYLQQTQKTVPLLDGAVMCVLRLGEPTAPGWHLLAAKLGRVPSSSSSVLASLIDDCLVRASISFDQVDNILLNAGHSRYWSRTSEHSNLNQACEVLSDVLPCQVENTAVVPMLAFAQALLNLPKSIPPTLFTAPQTSTSTSNKGYFIFCTVGHDGNVVILALKHQKTTC